MHHGNGDKARTRSLTQYLIVPRAKSKNSWRYSFCSAVRADSSSLRLAESTFGYVNCNFCRVCTTAAATTTRVYHLLSAGTMYQGAAAVAVWRTISSYASM